MEALAEPAFKASQIVQATAAAKSFGNIRRQARKAPVLVMNRGGADVVIVDFNAYSRMYAESEAWREAQIDSIAAERLEDHSPMDFDPEELSLINEIDPGTIPDAELFE